MLSATKSRKNVWRGSCSTTSQRSTRKNGAGDFSFVSSGEEQGVPAHRQSGGRRQDARRCAGIHEALVEAYSPRRPACRSEAPAIGSEQIECHSGRHLRGTHRSARLRDPPGARRERGSPPHFARRKRKLKPANEGINVGVDWVF